MNKRDARIKITSLLGMTGKIGSHWMTEIEKVLDEYAEAQVKKSLANPSVQGMLPLADLEKELAEVLKHQDFASRHSDSEGYMRCCGQQVLLERMIEKVKRQFT